MFAAGHSGDQSQTARVGEQGRLAAIVPVSVRLAPLSGWHGTRNDMGCCQVGERRDDTRDDRLPFATPLLTKDMQ